MMDFENDTAVDIISNEQVINAAIGKRLKQARLKAGYRSGSAFAIAHHIPVSTYLNYESGNRTLSIAQALHYCSLLDIPVSWLVLGDGESNSG